MAVLRLYRGRYRASVTRVINLLVTPANERADLNYDLQATEYIHRYIGTYVRQSLPAADKGASRRRATRASVNIEQGGPGP